ncbi:MAG: GyrI-like domain-containing protein, partial [Thermoplasmata archaeon]
PVAVRELPAGRAAFIEHSGPYWTVGATLRRVHEQRTTSIEPIELFARFASSPLGSRSGALRAEVGYSVPSDAVAPDGFRLVDRDAELVAYLAFNAGDAPRAQHFSQLRQWIVQHGYRAVGPVTEVYSFAPGDEPSISRVELQMTIRAANDPRIEAERRSGPVTIQVAQPADTNTLSPASAAPDLDEAPEPRIRSAPVAEILESTTPFALAVVVDPPTLEEPVAGGRSPDDVPAAPAIGRTGTEPSSAAESGHGEVERREGNQGASNRCAELAKELLRHFQELSPDTRTWLGATLLRIDAIGRALRLASVAPNAVAACSSTLSQEYRVFHSTPFVSAPRVPSAASARTNEQKAILRDLDGLMVRLAAKRVEIGQAGDELAALFERIRTIVDAERSASAEAETAPP